MRKVFIIGALKGVKVNCPPNAYTEKIIIGRYTIKAMLFPEGGYAFHIFKGDVLKAILSNEEWFISKVDGECQNLLNRLLRLYG